MLEGADRDWTPWSSEIYRDYTNLREGRYRFRVRAANAYGAQSEEGFFAFRVRPPAWRSPWALGAYCVGLGLLLWAGHRARVRLLQRRNRVLKAQVAAATAALEQEKRSLEAANARLVTLDQTKGRMLDIVAHDLRSPISVVLLETELLSGSPEVEASAANIRQSAHRMQELVQRFLDLESIERGGMALNIQPVDTLPLLREALEGQRGKARAKGLDLRIDAPVEPLPPLRADPMILREVLENLVSNAIKFSPPGPPARSVTLAAGPGWFSVQDEGPGFTEADKAKAFEEFARLSARPTGGESSSGLGLAIVRSLVHNLQGSIELESAEGEGALFRVHLPLWTG
jgi:signal transduction histidine kinase